MLKIHFKLGHMTIFFIICIGVFAFFIGNVFAYTIPVIKKGKLLTAKIAKKEFGWTSSDQESSSHPKMERWFIFEIEVDNKVLKNRYPISEYTENLKVGDSVSVRVYKDNFFV